VYIQAGVLSSEHRLSESWRRTCEHEIKSPDKLRLI